MANTQGIIKIIAYHRKKIRFLVLFILFFSIGHSLLFFYRNQVTPFLVYKLHSEAGSRLINLFFHNELTTFQDGAIVSDNVRLSILWGCEGIDGILILISALLAFPARLIQKLIGIITGSLIIYISNLVRLVTLYFTIKNKPAIFDFMHMYIGQTFYIFIILLFFISWALTCEKIDKKRVR